MYIYERSYRRHKWFVLENNSLNIDIRTLIRKKILNSLNTICMSPPNLVPKCIIRNTITSTNQLRKALFFRETNHLMSVSCIPSDISDDIILYRHLK